MPASTPSSTSDRGTFPTHRRAVAAAVLLAVLAACDDDDDDAPPLSTGTIGAAGGTVSVADGSVVLTVPAGALTGDVGFRIDPAATPTIRLGRYVAEGLTWAYGYQGGIVVYELDDDGRIVHQWVIGGSP